MWLISTTFFVSLVPALTNCHCNEYYLQLNSLWSLCDSNNNNNGQGISKNVENVEDVVETTAISEKIPQPKTTVNCLNCFYPNTSKCTSGALMNGLGSEVSKAFKTYLSHQNELIESPIRIDQQNSTATKHTLTKLSYPSLIRYLFYLNWFPVPRIFQTQIDL